MRGQWLVSMAGVLVGLVACEGKHREFVSGPLPGDGDGMGATSPGTSGSGTGDAGDRTGTGEGPGSGIELVGQEGVVLPPGSLGAVCGGDVDCDAPSRCVDGVCCSSACTELCAACDLPGSLGTCSAAPSDTTCAPLQCAGFSTDCRELDSTQLALNCESFGVCRASAECAIIQRPEGTSCQAGTGTCDGAGACLVPGKVTLGESCSGNEECAEGHCVAAGDSGALICCDAACDGPCQACSPAGHCEAAPASDPTCEAVTCPADNVCRDYTAGVAESLCRSFGQCQTGQDCPFTQLRPNAECSCDQNAACTLTLGAACTVNEECGSGACVADAQGSTVCCATSCAGGLFCSSEGADCVACEGSAIECDGTVERRCNGGASATVDCPNGCTPGVGCNDLPPVGFACDGGQCAAPAVCQQDVGGQARCCSRNCAAEGKVCAENGSCVCAEGQIQAGSDCLLQDGDPCNDVSECQAGSSCTDGVCCQEACNGACERCEPNTGLCVAIGAGQQDNQCNNGRQCMGARGDCRLTLRQQCFGNGATCVSNNCEPTVGNNTQICCAQSCSGTRPFCRSDGSSCTQCESNLDCGNGCNTQTGLCRALLAVGTECGSTSQCGSSALCLFDQNGQARCCERDCAREGRVCDGNGRCVIPTVGAGQPCVEGVINCSGNFRCIGSTCQLPVVGEGQSCGAVAICNGNLGLECLNSACRCPANERFVDGRCGLVDGQGCQLPRDCASGICTRWLVDVDGDGFGSLQSVGGFPAQFVCGDGREANRPPNQLFVDGCRGNDVSLRYAPSGTVSGSGAIIEPLEDCCDQVPCGQQLVIPSTEAFPRRPTGRTGAANCGPDEFTFDFDCDGFETIIREDLPPVFVDCAIVAGVCTGGGRTTEPVCGGSVSSFGCFMIDGICQTPEGRGPPTSTPVSCR